MKKVVTIALFLIIMLASFAVTISAEEIASGSCGAQGDNLTWTLDDTGTLTISGEGEMDVKGYSSSQWSEFNQIITSVNIGAGVLSIDDLAFANCINLAEIIISNSVNKIGDSAFWCCEKLKSIQSIPPSCHVISQNGRVILKYQ